jgi:hypothetical protein
MEPGHLLSCQNATDEVLAWMHLRLSLRERFEHLRVLTDLNDDLGINMGAARLVAAVQHQGPAAAAVEHTARHSSFWLPRHVHVLPLQGFPPRYVEHRNGQTRLR